MPRGASRQPGGHPGEPGAEENAASPLSLRRCQHQADDLKCRAAGTPHFVLLHARPLTREEKGRRKWRKGAAAVPDPRRRPRRFSGSVHRSTGAMSSSRVRKDKEIIADYETQVKGAVWPCVSVLCVHCLCGAAAPNPAARSLQEALTRFECAGNYFAFNREYTLPCFWGSNTRHMSVYHTHLDEPAAPAVIRLCALLLGEMMGCRVVRLWPFMLSHSEGLCVFRLGFFSFPVGLCVSEMLGVIVIAALFLLRAQLVTRIQHIHSVAEIRKCSR